MWPCWWWAGFGIKASTLNEGSVALWANTLSSAWLRAGFKETLEKAREVWVICRMPVCMCLYAACNYFYTRLINFSLYFIWDYICLSFSLLGIASCCDNASDCFGSGKPLKNTEANVAALKSGLKVFCDENYMFCWATPSCTWVWVQSSWSETSQRCFSFGTRCAGSGALLGAERQLPEREPALQTPCLQRPSWEGQSHLG